MKIDSLEKSLQLLQSMYAEQLQINKKMEAKVDGLVSGMQYMKGMLETIVHEGLDPSCNRCKISRTASSSPASSSEHNSTIYQAPQPTKLPPSSVANTVHKAPSPPKNRLNICLVMRGVVQLQILLILKGGIVPN